MRLEHGIPCEFQSGLLVVAACGGSTVMFRASLSASHRPCCALTLASAAYFGTPVKEEDTDIRRYVGRNQHIHVNCLLSTGFQPQARPFRLGTRLLLSKLTVLLEETDSFSLVCNAPIACCDWVFFALLAQHHDAWKVPRHIAPKSPSAVNDLGQPKVSPSCIERYPANSYL